MRAGTSGAACGVEAGVAVEEVEGVRPGARFGPEDDPHEIGDELGHGAASRVFACKRLRTGEDLAVKVVNLQRLELVGDVDKHVAKLEREVSILQQLGHARIVSLQSVHRTSGWYFLVMERIWGGELFQQIVKKKNFTELEARHVFRQLLEGVSFMHSRGVIHRDIKPENILVVRSQPAPAPAVGSLLDVKIADFGLSKVISDGASLAKTFVGTPQYWAPEVLDVQDCGGSYSQAADLWGLGVVLFVTLCGRYPFDGRQRPIQEQIKAASFNMGTSRWRSVSAEAKDLVQGLLRVSPRERLCLQSCFHHPWVMGTDYFQGLSENPNVDADMHLPDPRSLHVQIQEEKTTNAGSPKVPPEGHGGGVGQSESGLREAVLDGAASHESQRKSATSRALSAASSQEIVEVQGRSTSAMLLEPHRYSRCWAPIQVLLWLVWALPLLVLSALTLQRREGEGSPPWPGWRSSTEVIPWKEPAKQPVPRANKPVERSCRLPGADRHASTTGCSGNSVTTSPAQWGDVEVPVVQFHDIGSADACKEQETVFRLSELLTLQVSIIGSLEMASLAFRHTDRDLSATTRKTFFQARELFQQAANVIWRYANVARQVGETVLPDLHLAVIEKQPNLAVSLLVLVKQWVIEMRSDGEGIRKRYSQLQESVLDLLQRAQHSKTQSDELLMQDTRALGVDVSSSMPDNFALEALKPQIKLSGLKVCTSPAPPGNLDPAVRAAARAEGQLPVNAFTQQLFERLGEMTTGGVPTGASAHGVHQLEAWKRDVLDLLFMAPGALPSLPAPLADDDKFAENAQTEGEQRESGELDEDSEESSNAGTGFGQDFARKEHGKRAMGPAARSSAILLRALRELRRVDAILQGCSSFWTNMDGTVQKLAKMKEHTEALVTFAADNVRLRERFDQRLKEYASFWSSLERISHRYCEDHQSTSTRMHKLIREVEAAADVFDTTESVKNTNRRAHEEQDPD